MTSPAVDDTFPDFAVWWDRARHLSIPEQVTAWAEWCGSQWPELLRKQKRAYASGSLSWRTVAEMHVFPRLRSSWPSIEKAHRALLVAIPWSEARIRRLLNSPTRVCHVIHVGIGCGAGWATSYRGHPAILYGLENAAEAGWTTTSRMESHVAHELAHLAHDDLRRQAGEGALYHLRGPFLQLYGEGFATEVERQVMTPRKARSVDRDPNWSRWCRAHRRALSRRFLRDVSHHGSVRPFFGSWYAIGGHIETGYWLGAEIVRGWQPELSLREIATLPNPLVRKRVRDALTRWSIDRGPPSSRSVEL